MIISFAPFCCSKCPYDDVIVKFLWDHHCFFIRSVKECVTMVTSFFVHTQSCTNRLCECWTVNSYARPCNWVIIIYASERGQEVLASCLTCFFLFACSEPSSLLAWLGLHLGFPGSQASHDFYCELPMSSHVNHVNHHFRVPRLLATIGNVAFPSYLSTCLFQWPHPFLFLGPAEI